MNLPLHGSNPAALYQSFSIPIPDRYIDFSVNLNPFGIPENIKESWSNWLELIEDYPDPFGSELQQIIASYEKVKYEHILLGNGGAQLITLLANFLAQKRIAIVQPTFVEYEKMCAAFQCDIHHVVLEEGKWDDLSSVLHIIPKVDAIFLCHPNNPTGTTYSKEQIELLIEHCEQNECYLIVDEAFYHFVVDFTTAATYVPLNNYVIVIRSLTKMYSIAGLRLGYVLGSTSVIQSLQTIQPHWSVNAIALEAGRYCFANEVFVNKTQAFVTNEREKIKLKLQQLNYVVSKSDVNYFLLRDERLANQNVLIHFLLTVGIVPRHTENFRGLDGRWIRLAVKSSEENTILLKVLQKWQHSNKID